MAARSSTACAVRLWLSWPNKQLIDYQALDCAYLSLLLLLVTCFVVAVVADMEIERLMRLLVSVQILALFLAGLSRRIRVDSFFERSKVGVFCQFWLCQNIRLRFLYKFF